ncbi:MAG: GNAT family N-acetyltransferase [Candidatus Eisenbacteria bacterium]
MTPPAASVRRADESDLDAVRQLRLRALAGAPLDFDDSLEVVRQWDDREWRRWFDARAIFVLELQGQLHGMVAADPHDRDPRTMFLGAMWLDPEARGRGAAGMLIDALNRWASDQGVERLLLHVVEDNAAARRAYERAGFRLTGAAPQHSEAAPREVEMEKRLS